MRENGAYLLRQRHLTLTHEEKFLYSSTKSESSDEVTALLPSENRGFLYGLLQP